ncbi:response regulator [Leptolyngbya sp. NK1-12]|uniref:histidine kinase n=1 Tax=Leptolyngbya sp. NK1-12 TaxID=2547451 RepID=A0AA96WBS2_9CYAN|nr:response regulator [Leptolyngbya sp. NK1-12]
MDNRENILVVDDKPDNLRLLSNILVKEGYKVRKVLNGRLAIDAAQLDPPDLILLDIMMPDPDGYQVCQALKANPQTQEIPIIFLSALDTVTNKVKAFTVGGVDYITKPFQQEEVLARVKTHLNLQRLNRALQQRNLLLKQEVKRRRKTEATLKQTLQELQDTQKQIILKEKLASLGALMAGIAHELRNPLNFVNNYAEGSIELVDDILADLVIQLAPDQSEALQAALAEVRANAVAIHQHGQRAERIIQTMMQHTRTEPGERQLVNLANLLKEATELAYHSRRAQFPDFNVTIETDHDATLGFVNVAPSDLSRAFINLIDNACYAVYKQQQQNPAHAPRIAITTRKLVDQIEIKIWDNGIGIESDTLTKVFDPFFTTKANEGTGLGLSITYDVIVGQHRGTLSVNSEPGSFTEFIVTLPL